MTVPSMSTLMPVGGVEDPGPDRARDDERDRHRQQEDAPEDRLAADLLVDEDREQQAQDAGSRLTNTSVNTRLLKTSLVQKRGVEKIAS